LTKGFLGEGRNRPLRHEKIPLGGGIFPEKKGGKPKYKGGGEKGCLEKYILFRAVTKDRVKSSLLSPV